MERMLVLTNSLEAIIAANTFDNKVVFFSLTLLSRLVQDKDSHTYALQSSATKVAEVNETLQRTKEDFVRVRTELRLEQDAKKDVMGSLEGAQLLCRLNLCRRELSDRTSSQ
jgi:hypothetical protein